MRRPREKGAEVPGRGDFAVTLGLTRAGLTTGRWYVAPLGLAVHGLALAAVVLAALFGPIEEMRPALAPLVLQLAPPPPPPLRRGSPIEIEGLSEASSGEPGSFSVSVVRPRAPRILEANLTPAFDVPLGVEDGFDEGTKDGMAGGIPGGLPGGVPGGIVGGAVGGLGTELPRFPEPDVGPSPIRMPRPSYTQQAIRDNVQGVVVLRVVIDEQGKVQVLKVLRSVPELDEEAIRVVESRWRFEPATKDGRPVPTLSDLRVRFNLF